MSESHFMDDAKREAIFSTPAIGGFTLYAITLEQWVAIATIIYIALQIGFLLLKYYDEFVRRFGKKKCKDKKE